MSQVVRSRALWAAVGSITLAVVLLITLAPARDVTHTALGWLRVTALELESDDGPGDSSGPSAAATPTPTLAEIVEVVSIEPSTTIQDSTSADIDGLPFEVVSLELPITFPGKPARSITTFGTVTLQLDTADLAGLLAPGFRSRRLARRIGTDEVTVAGGALVVSEWTADDDGEDSITLFQIEAPLVSGLPSQDLELIAELLVQAFVPPILSGEIDVLEIPLVQLALGLDLEAEEKSASPTLTDLPTGGQAVTWTHDRSQFVLTGPLPAEDLLRLAETARVEH